MNTKIYVCGLLLMLVIPVLFFVQTYTQHPIASLFANFPDDESNITSYSDHIIVDQAQIQLNHEVIQYKIIFHQNDTINVSTFLALQQFGRDYDPQACLLILANGTTSIFRKSNVSFLFYVPSAILFDATLFGHRITFGGRLFFKLLNHTRYRIGISRYLSNDAEVKKGDVWYLTMAVFHSKPGEQMKLALTSLSSSPSMELIQLNRHTNIGFYSSLDNDFEGRYMGVKLPFLPFGFSVANNLHTEVLTTKGSFLYFCSVGHAKGRMKVHTPDNKTYLNVNNKISLFFYYGNLTGRWEFSASGIGFPWKHLVMLFYADIDPYITL
jgi:hypothetical protein